MAPPSPKRWEPGTRVPSGRRWRLEGVRAPYGHPPRPWQAQGEGCYPSGSMATSGATPSGAERGADSSLGYTAVARREESAALRHGAGIAGEYLLDLALLLAASLVASHLHRTVADAPIVADRWLGARPLAAVALALALTHGTRLAFGALPYRARYLAPFAAALLAAAALAAFAPGWPAARAVTFAAVAVGLLALVLPWPRRGALDERRSLTDDLRRLWGRRQLVRIWVHYNVRSRYAQAVLGILWIALVPLATALVMTVAFSQILGRDVGDVPFISFLLAGVIPWNTFRQAVGAAMSSIRGSMNLFNQVYFPREIIVLAAFGEVLVDGAVMFATMFVINAVVGVWPNPYYLLLPPLIAIQVALTLGLMLIVGWLSALIRDVAHFVNVALQMLFYLCAVIYPADLVPDEYRFLIDLNPIAVLIAAYRDVLIYDRAPDWGALLYPAALAAGVLVFGYRLFKAHEDTLADLA
jgi:lipopolysaccharide transport system permease protein